MGTKKVNGYAVFAYSFLITVQFVMIVKGIDEDWSVFFMLTPILVVGGLLSLIVIIAIAIAYVDHRKIMKGRKYMEELHIAKGKAEKERREFDKFLDKRHPEI